MSREKKARAARRRERDSLCSEVWNLHNELDELYSRFDLVTDADQVDACIYEMNALISKYDYAVRCLKEFDGSA